MTYLTALMATDCILIFTMYEDTFVSSSRWQEPCWVMQ